MLPAASTFTRADEVGVFGTVIVAAPLFGIPEASVNGKLLPPSIESSTLTLAQLMGALEIGNGAMTNKTKLTKMRMLFFETGR